MTDNERMTLGNLNAGQAAHVAELQGGRGFAARMAALGFTPGARITMVQNFGHGPVIVLVRDTRIALGRGEVSRVRVTLNGDSHE